LEFARKRLYHRTREKFHNLYDQISSPPWILIHTHPKTKVCTVSVKNNDQKCFVWSVLVSFYQASDNISNLHKYLLYEQTLNTANLNFPLALKDIQKFEILNPSISVNVLSHDDKNFCIEYCSPESNRLHHLNLLLLSQGDKKHHVCIKTCPVWSVAELIIIAKHSCAIGVSIPFLPKMFYTVTARNACVNLHRSRRLHPQISSPRFESFLSPADDDDD